MRITNLAIAATFAVAACRGNVIVDRDDGDSGVHGGSGPHGQTGFGGAETHASASATGTFGAGGVTVDPRCVDACERYAPCSYVDFEDCVAGCSDTSASCTAVHDTWLQCLLASDAEECTPPGCPVIDYLNCELPEFSGCALGDPPQGCLCQGSLTSVGIDLETHCVSDAATELANCECYVDDVLVGECSHPALADGPTYQSCFLLSGCCGPLLYLHL